MQARFADLIEFEASRAREWYGSGLRLLATIDRRDARNHPDRLSDRAHGG